jgi:acetyltransferase-like isoleucine patch superfamily enzyme
MKRSEEWKQKWKMPEIVDMKPTKWGWVVQYPERFKLGKYTDIGYGTYINSNNGVVIEDDVQIGSHVSIYSENSIDATWGLVILKKGCMIGAHSVILPCVVIGEDAKVGAFSLVKNDIPDNSVAFGIPAKVKYPINR